VPEAVIRQRYTRSIKNLFALYLPLADNWSFFDNSSNKAILVAEKQINQPLIIIVPEIWQVVKSEF